MFCIKDEIGGRVFTSVWDEVENQLFAQHESVKTKGGQQRGEFVDKPSDRIDSVKRIEVRSSFKCDQ